MAKSKLIKTNEKIAEVVVGGYKKKSRKEQLADLTKLLISSWTIF